MTNTQDTTDFGFTRVPRSEKTARVGEVFASVAGRYDLMNDVMSLGLHRLWKRQFVARVKPRAGEEALDLAGGTGDIARGLFNAAQARITLCDINPAMLQSGKQKAIDTGYYGAFRWVCGNAETLPFPDHHFHACTIAFGIRNVTERAQALTEIHRVLKPGGRFFCMEFSQLTLPWLQGLYDRYSFAVIPRMGKWITGDAASYQYLVESIRQFPTQSAFATELTEAGFYQVRHENLNHGVVAIHQGWKL
jgi:demethylmenaquinone methyltransferase/2-methoxy-6-polyprenyl-1,4-benzoquinol methylase